MDFDKICRVCLVSGQEMIPIFNVQSGESYSEISNILSTITIYKVSQEDKFPQLICRACMSTAKSAYLFKEKCENSYRILLKILSKDDSEMIIDSRKTMHCEDKCIQTEYSLDRYQGSNRAPETVKFVDGKQHKINEIVCSACHQIFDSIGGLRSHKALFHTGTADNQCCLCERQFTRRQHMRRHLAVIHKIVEDIDEDSGINESGEIDGIVSIKNSNRPMLSSKNQIEIATSLNERIPRGDQAGGHCYEPPYTEFGNEDEKLLSALISTNKMQKTFNTGLLDEPEVKLTEIMQTTEEQNDFERPQSIFVSSTAHIPPFEEKCLTKNPSECVETNSEPIDNVSNSTSYFKIDHLKKHDAIVLDSDNRKLKCADCDKPFAHSAQLKRHMNAKHGEKIYICAVCDKRFTTKIRLHHHMEGHQKKRFNCKECSQSYLSKKELNVHIKTEGHDKPMLCPECGLRCKTKNILMVHMRRHKGEKPFKCKFCSKGFPRMDDLRVHEKYHTNERSHFCETCGKGFQRKYNLTIHLRVHTGERPYKCPHCTQAFAQGNDLKAHIRRHTGERFRCNICSAAFLQGYQIRQHKLAEHGIKEEPPTQRVAKFTSAEEQEHQIKQNLQRDQN